MTPRARIPALLAALLLAAPLVGCMTEPEPLETPLQTIPAPTTPAEPSPTPTDAAEAGPGGIDPIELGMPFDEALAAAGASPVGACEWVATAPGDGYTLSIQRVEPAAGDPPPVELVSTSAPVDAARVVGPRTAAGIGIGSTVEEALAAYPDAESLAPDGMGDRRYLRVETGDGAQALFLTYTEGQPLIWAVTATTFEVPPYEPCA